jgi:hypothetical protein
VLAVTFVALSALFAVSPRAAATEGLAALAAPPSLRLVSQSPFVTPGQPLTLTLTLTHGGGSKGQLGFVLTLYNRLTSRSAFDQTLGATPDDGILDHTEPIVAGTNDQSTLTLGVTTGQQPATGAADDATLHLNCADCPGVYPLEVELEALDTGAVLGHFTTYLTYTDPTSAQPLQVALVLPVATPLVIRTGTSAAAQALAPPSRSAVAALGHLLDDLGAASGVATTLDVVPQSLQGLEASGATGRRVVSQLATLSTRGNVEIPSPSFVPVDVGSLSSLGTELAAQMKTGAAVLSALGITAEHGTWLATGTSTASIGTDLADGLRQIGATQVVVPAASLAPSAGDLGNVTAPFALQLGHDTTVTAAAADSGLAAHFTAEPDDPALGAQQLLADLAFIYFEEPNLATPRGVVAVAPTAWRPSASFVTTMLDGLRANPDVQTVTLDHLFTDVATSDDPSDSRRPLDSGVGPVLPTNLATAVVAARGKLTAFDSAVIGNPPILTQLDELLLSSESSELRSNQRRAGVSTAERCLSAQLSLVQLATDRTITLTARTASVPITILSNAPYSLVGNLVLNGDKFIFPDGSSHTSFLINHNSNSLRIVVQARTTGDLPLAVTLSTPRLGLVIAHGQLTVRSTATSLAGVVLTLAAVAVLLTWWARTWRRGRAARRAGQPRHGGADAK